jgi:WD40 repeat protein
VCVEREDVARLYDCATGAERQLAGHRDFVSGLAFSPDGLTLATGSMDGTIRLWNVARGETIASLPGHMQETTDVAFSPDGRTLASLGRNESLKLWHLPTLREVVSENEPHAGLWLRFSPDGRKLAVETDTHKLRLLAAPPE